jgi:carbohydrate-binding DOMON domain-containing protein
MYINNAETLKVFPTPNRMFKVFVMMGSKLKLPREILVVYTMGARVHTHTHTHTRTRTHTHAHTRTHTLHKHNIKLCKDKSVVHTMLML